MKLNIWPWKRIAQLEKERDELRSDLDFVKSCHGILKAQMDSLQENHASIKEESENHKNSVRRMATIMAMRGYDRLILVILLISLPCFGQPVLRNNVTTNVLVVSPADGWFIGTASSVPTWTVNGGSLTNIKSFSSIIGNVDVNQNLQINNAVTRYLAVSGALFVDAVESNVSVPFLSGTLTNFYIKVKNLGVNTNWTFTMMTNGVASNVSVHVIGNPISSITYDNSSSVLIPDRCTLSWRLTGDNPTANDSTVKAIYNFQFAR